MKNIKKQIVNLIFFAILFNCTCTYPMMKFGEERIQQDIPTEQNMQINTDSQNSIEILEDTEPQDSPRIQNQYGTFEIQPKQEDLLKKLEELKKMVPRCTICLKKFKNHEQPLACGHTFHPKCLNEWRNAGRSNSNLCPICQKKILTMDELKYNQEQEEWLKEKNQRQDQNPLYDIGLGQHSLFTECCAGLTFLSLCIALCCPVTTGLSCCCPATTCCCPCCFLCSKLGECIENRHTQEQAPEDQE